jgi:hypothetical protein
MVERRQVGAVQMNFTRTTDEAIPMCNETPNAESTAEAYSVETTTVDETRRGTGKFAHLRRGVD